MAETMAKERALELLKDASMREKDVQEALESVERALDAWRTSGDARTVPTDVRRLRIDASTEASDGFCATLVVSMPKSAFRGKDYLDGRYFRARRKAFKALQTHLTDVPTAIVGGCGTRGRALRLTMRHSNVDVVFRPQEGSVDAKKARMRAQEGWRRRWNARPDEAWPRCRAAMACDANALRCFEAEKEAMGVAGELGRHAGALLSRWAVRAGACEGRDALPWDAFRREALRIAAECVDARPNALQVARAAMKGFAERGKGAWEGTAPPVIAAWDRPEGANAQTSGREEDPLSKRGRTTNAEDRTSLLQPCECASPSAVSYAGYLSECGLALLDSHLVAQQSVDVVDAAFASGKVHPVTRFDLLLRIGIPSEDHHVRMSPMNSATLEEQVYDENRQDAVDDVDDPVRKEEDENQIPDEEEVDENLLYDQGISRAMEDAVEHVVRVALGQRAKIVRAIGRDHAHHRRGTITVGVVLDPKLAFARVEMGPKASQTELAKAFRERHGPRTSLRRFANGTVCEAVVWAQNDWERHRCPSRMAKAALRRAFPGIQCAAVGNALDGVLEESVSKPVRMASVEGGNPRVNKGQVDPREVALVGDRLSHVLRRIEGLPLRVSGVLMLPPSMHILQAFPTNRHELLGMRNWDESEAHNSNGSLSSRSRKRRNQEEMIPLCIDPTEVHVVLEGSGRWPAHPEAAAKARSAFLLQIAERLSTDMGIDSISSESFVDVLFEGFAFRLTLDPQGGQEPSAGTEASNFQIRNKHYSVLAALVDEQPEFAPAVRLAKRWIAGHMLSGHIRDETVELLVASCFTRPYVCQAPATRVAGFCRFLELLSTHPWTSQPLLVDLNAEMTKSSIDLSMMQFDRARKQGTGPPMCIILPDDVQGKRWTASHPCKEVLNKARELARTTFLKIVDMYNAVEVNPSKWKSLFVSSQAGNDVVLVLRQEALKAPQQSLCPAHVLLPQQERASLLEADFAKPRKQARAAMHMKAERLLHAGRDGALNALLIGFDPVKRYVNLLRDRFSTFCYIFMDEYGGCTIGIKWKAKAFLPGKGNDTSKVTRTSPEEVKAATDVSELVSEMLALGEGLVKGAFLL